MIIAYDKILMRPGCALLQAAYGGDSGIASHFDTEDWLLFPTPDLKPYTVTKEELTAVVRLTVRQRVINEIINTKGKNT